MELWSYVKRTVTETGGGAEPIPIGLERNPGAVTELGHENPPDVHLYMLRVGLSSGFGGTEAGIPVYRHVNPSPHPVLKEIYQCEVAGRQLEAANVFAIREKVQRTLEVIAPNHTLPLCYFRAPRFDYSLPVYEQGARLVIPVLTGPKIRGRELADLRGPVTRWLRSAGYLMEREEPEVQVVRPSDLRLVPPAAVIRCLDDDGLWMPTVEGTSPAGPVIGLLVHPAELQTSERRRVGASEAPPPSGTDVTALLRYLGAELARGGHLVDPWGLYASDVRSEIWARTEELTDPTERYLHCFLEGAGELRLAIRHTAAGEVATALQEEAVTVFLAGDDDALARAVGRYLTGAGFLRHAEDLRVEVSSATPAESLDPDAIWTPPGGEPLAPAETSTDQEAITDQEVASK